MVRPSRFLLHRRKGKNIMIEIHNCSCAELIQKGYFDDKKICVVTDPPFNVGYHYRTYKDKMSEDDYFDFLSEILLCARGGGICFDSLSRANLQIIGANRNVSTTCCVMGL